MNKIITTLRSPDLFLEFLVLHCSHMKMVCSSLYFPTGKFESGFRTNLKRDLRGIKCNY